MTDFEIAKKYVNKAKDAKVRGQDFDLGLLSFVNMMKGKKCQYSGIKLDNSVVDGPFFPTVDRIDNQKGYVRGNVVVCCKFINQWKGSIENPNNPLNLKMAIKVLTKWSKQTK